MGYLYLFILPTETTAAELLTRACMTAAAAIAAAAHRPLTNTHRDRHTDNDHATPSVATACIYAIHTGTGRPAKQCT